VIASVENHHNFAWKETHFGRELIVHRKGSTPAAKGALGVIPGSMASPAYLVRGLGQPESLNSAAHGAGRQMSRKAAKRAFNWHDLNELLRARGLYGHVRTLVGGAPVTAAHAAEIGADAALFQLARVRHRAVAAHHHQRIDPVIDDVLQRRQGQLVMPAWQSEPSVNAHIMDLYAYLSARAQGSQGPGRPAP